MTQNNDVDINVLVKLYNQRLSTLVNQNVFLEAKIQTMTQEFALERQRLIDINIQMQKDYEVLLLVVHPFHRAQQIHQLDLLSLLL